MGDALGLPAEGMTPERIRRLGWGHAWCHRFFLGRGMWSDDTEHTIMLAQAALAAEGDESRFVRAFAWELRWWLWGLPAGVGLGTALSTICARICECVCVGVHMCTSMCTRACVHNFVSNHTRMCVSARV